MNKSATIITETPRLILRHFTHYDLDALAPILADPQVMYFSARGIQTREQTRKFINWILSSYQEAGFGLSAVIYKDNYQLIGFCGLLVWELKPQQEVEIGYRFATKYWGKGLGTEAAIAVRDYAWNQLDLNRLICIIQPENKRSIRVAEKIGMKYEKKTIFIDLEVVIYSMSKSVARQKETKIINDA